MSYVPPGFTVREWAAALLWIHEHYGEPRPDLPPDPDEDEDYDPDEDE